VSRIFGRLQVADLAQNIMVLVDAIRGFLEKLNGAHLNVFLADWPSANCRKRSIEPQGLPVLYWMPAAVQVTGNPGTHIVGQLASLANQIAWGQTYSAQDFGPEFLESYGWAELIGQRGPIASSRIACGFLMLGPQIEYPRHNHAAEEVYVPLTGKTLWQQGHDKWTYRKSCRPIYHASRVTHAMRTEAVPLLALYLWRGADLTEKSRIQ